MLVYAPLIPIFGFSRPEAISSSSFEAAKIVFWRSNVGPFCARPKRSAGYRFDVISGSENTSVMADKRIFWICSTLV